MRILCVTPSYWPAFQYGGPIFVVHYLNAALVRSGVEVVVYTTSVGLEGRVQESQETDVDGVTVTYFPIAKSLEILGTTGWQFSWEMTKALRRNIRNFDLVHINAVWNFPSIIAALLARLLRRPFILTVHGALYPATIASGRWKKLPYFYLLARPAFGGAAAIHFTGEDEEQKCRSMFGPRTPIAVVPYVLDLAELTEDEAESPGHTTDKQGRRTILFLSRISWKKGLDLLVEAVAILKKGRNDFRLVIVGADEGGYAERIQGRIRALGLSVATTLAPDDGADVTFKGILTGADKARAFKESDMFVLPSYSENFGVAAVEAMACGVPIIISDQVGIYREIAEAQAGIVVQTDATQLAGAIARLLDEHATRVVMGANGRRLVKNKFSAPKVLDEMMGLYSSAAGGGTMRKSRKRSALL